MSCSDIQTTGFVFSVELPLNRMHPLQSYGLSGKRAKDVNGMSLSSGSGIYTLADETSATAVVPPMPRSLERVPG